MRFVLKPHHTPRFKPLSRPGDPDVRTLEIPGYRQTRTYTCGFATTMMVMHYFGATVPGHELFQRLGTGRDGTRQNAIVRELRGSGVRVNVRYDVDFARVAREIDRDKLIIAYLADLEHWIVIYGYGSEPERVYVADPRAKQPCEHMWQSYGPRLNAFGIICSAPRARTDAAVNTNAVVAPAVSRVTEIAPAKPQPAEPASANPPSLRPPSSCRSTFRSRSRRARLATGTVRGRVGECPK